MKASGYLLLSALVAASAASAAQHQLRALPDHHAHLVARSPQPTPLGPGFSFGGGSSGDSSDSGAAAATSASNSVDPFGIASSRSAAAASSSSAAAASSSAAAAASSSSAAAAASASASAAAAESSSIAAHAASSAAASISSASAAAASSSSAAASRSLASAASASLASTSSAALTTSTGLTTTLTATVVASATSGAPSTTAVKESSSGSKSGGASTGLIIGVSVAGGVIVLIAFIFLYFKFGTRRFSNFDDGDADIKWPELKHDPDSNVMQPLPARRTGRAGFGMGDDDSDNEGGEHDGNGADGVGEKGRDSFSGSTTALAAAPPAGYGVNDYQPGMEHGYGVDPAAGYYQDHHMYGAHQYAMQTSPGAPGGAFPDSSANPYGVDPYAHAGMSHPQQQPQYPHGHYQ
ncbi:hypothetical protein EX895_005577 [Sporisorium graminicola]|uniref:Mid2 domain-containing protein n=1 Tax=Sporisorium graminicola TaxID=280036 RepID=A0A4U7KM57_9BASI|nr:hypothetical protein EX895_005577 [Sporisorium graminicola]TKY85415.1 hypothetical protein EX895_005577 [Sporisorium graminicola]